MIMIHVTCSGKCSLDALVYGHIEAIRNSDISQLSTPLHQYPNLLQFTDTVKHEHFNIGMVVIEEWFISDHVRHNTEKFGLDVIACIILSTLCADYYRFSRDLSGVIWLYVDHSEVITCTLL